MLLRSVDTGCSRAPTSTVPRGMVTVFFSRAPPSITAATIPTPPTAAGNAKRTSFVVFVMEVPSSCSEYPMGAPSRLLAPSRNVSISNRRSACLLHLVPQLVELFQRGAAHLKTALLRQLFNLFEAIHEFQVGSLQRGARVHGELSRKIHDREQQIPDLRFDRLPSPASRFPFDFSDLFFHLVQRPRRIRPVESNAGRALLQSIGHQQRRERRRQSCERAALAAGAGLAPFREFPSLMIAPA